MFSFVLLFFSVFKSAIQWFCNILWNNWEYPVVVEEAKKMAEACIVWVAKNCFWFLLKYFRDYIDFADFKACDTKVWWVVD